MNDKLIEALNFLNTLSKESYLYNENNILKNLREYCIAA